ncbi:hypothetical protein QJS10_CPA09g00005 [Acorus calamus]|uniref:Uncharacterized protein n=1 Tax=Acorus calamus TaxID=4465 RepID=A0AAV9E628_ACOCL|nr:hypothetical protein QJS10_CPA09g00005 [Acorus calamus]
MESPKTNEFFISRPENFGSFDLCKFFFSRKCLSTYQFVETSTQPGAPQFSLIVILTLFLEKILLFIYKPLKLLGNVIEFVLNFYALNGGVFGLLWRVLTVSVVIPDKNSASYRSVLAFIDSRVDLFNTASSSNKVYKINNTFNAVEPFDLTAMASKIAYENPAFVQNAVEKHWKMHLVKFFSCWNEFYKANTTQAFICSDKAKDAQLIVLAFRGTEPFNSQDWATDVNLSWISTGKMGKVHMGFMKALGLTDERDFAKGFPAESPLKDDPSKALAYYSIRDTREGSDNRAQPWRSSCNAVPGAATVPQPNNHTE